MTKTKKYKTVGGYLRSHEYSIEKKTGHLEGDEWRAAVKTAQRAILNHLLPQFSLSQIEDHIEPLKHIDLLLILGGTERQMKALKDCQRWLKNFRILSFRNATVTVVSARQGGQP